MFVASVVVIIGGSLATPGTVTGIGATMPVWDAHHTADVHCPKIAVPKYACPIGYDRNPSLPDQICDHDEFCGVVVPDPTYGIVWDYNMQFPSGTDLARAKQLVLTQLPSGARIVWYQPLVKYGVCSEMGLTSRTLAEALPIKGEGGVFVTLWWLYRGKVNPYLPPFSLSVKGATLKLWGSHATPQPQCGSQS
jgi:hypothetical protein